LLQDLLFDSWGKIGLTSQKRHTCSSCFQPLPSRHRFISLIHLLQPVNNFAPSSRIFSLSRSLAEFSGVQAQIPFTLQPWYLSSYLSTDQTTTSSFPTLSQATTSSSTVSHKQKPTHIAFGLSQQSLSPRASRISSTLSTPISTWSLSNITTFQRRFKMSNNSRAVSSRQRTAGSAMAADR
jgi:hypothetical protein